MAHRILYLPIAESDILEAINYIADKLDAPTAASNLIAELDNAIKRIAAFPYAHELYRTTRPMTNEIRKVPVKGFVLYYAVFEDSVEIRRFLHGRRNRSDII